MKHFLLIFQLLLTGTFTIAQIRLPYQNAKLPIDQRVKDIVSRMTLAEKVGQLNQLNGGVFTGPAVNDNGQKQKMQMAKEGKVGSMLNVIGTTETRAIQQIAMQSRLGIPLLFAYDVIHGYKTIFPIPLAEACSWDLNQIQLNSSIAASEASAAGIHWTFAPMCDISNDPRWGRVMEGAGEDPYYGALVAAARVKGFQGNLNDNKHLMACVKHFAAYGAVEAGREYNQVDISRVLLWNKYLPPYKAAVDAGAATVMNAFNVFEGVPVSGNKYLVTDILRKKWGFKGFLVSDWASFKEMIAHGYAADEKDAALKAFEAGSEMDMESQVTIKYLAELVKEGKVSVQQLDASVGKILYFKFKLGLFDDPYKYCDTARESNEIFTAENKLVARKAAQASIVLLKNENKVLPVATGKKIALVGFFANSPNDLLDFWIAQGKATDAVTLYDGLKNKYANISFSNGYLSDCTTNDSLIAAAVAQAATAEVVFVNIGISGVYGGEERSLAYPQISNGQIQLLKALKKTGKPIVALVSSGRPLILTEAEPLVDGIVQCWILGTEHGNAIADIVSGAYNPSGKTVMSFPYAIGQIPVYYNHFNTGRPDSTNGNLSWNSRYRDIPNEPLYPFGYGLSYSTFGYSDFNISKTVISKTDQLNVQVTINNTSNLTGEEVVQLYIRDYAASVIRPVKELKGFQKISLKPGEKRKINFVLTAKELSFFDAAGNIVFESGKFAVFVGGNSKEVMQLDFEVK